MLSHAPNLTLGRGEMVMVCQEDRRSIVSENPRCKQHAEHLPLHVEMVLLFAETDSGKSKHLV